MDDIYVFFTQIMLSYQVEHLGAMVESAMKLIEDYKSFVVRVNMGK